MTLNKGCVYTAALLSRIAQLGLYPLFGCHLSQNLQELITFWRLGVCQIWLRIWLSLPSGAAVLRGKRTPRCDYRALIGKPLQKTKGKGRGGKERASFDKPRPRIARRLPQSWKQSSPGHRFWPVCKGRIHEIRYTLWKSHLHMTVLAKTREKHHFSLAI